MAPSEQVTMSDGSVHVSGVCWVEWYRILIQTPLEVKAQMTLFLIFVPLICFIYRQCMTNTHDIMTIFLISLLNSNRVRHSKHLKEEVRRLVSIGASSPFGKKNIALINLSFSF